MTTTHEHRHTAGSIYPPLQHATIVDRDEDTLLSNPQVQCPHCRASFPLAPTEPLFSITGDYDTLPNALSKTSLPFILYVFNTQTETILPVPAESLWLSDSWSVVTQTRDGIQIIFDPTYQELTAQPIGTNPIMYAVHISEATK
jgi:hypothetical protein